MVKHTAVQVTKLLLEEKFQMRATTFGLLV
jgi:hypothetical protein